MRDVFHIRRQVQLDAYWDARCCSRKVQDPKCIGCGKSGWHFVQPYVIEWTRDRWSGKSQLVGDFVWPGVGYLTVTERVKVACELHGITGLRFYPVEARPVFQSTKSAKPVLVDAPPIWFGESIVTVHLDLARSGRKVINECQVCGQQTYDVAPNAPIVIVEPGDIALPDIFITHEVPVLFCTQRFRDLVRNERFTNVEIKRRGTVETLATSAGD